MSSFICTRDLPRTYWRRAAGWFIAAVAIVCLSFAASGRSADPAADEEADKMRPSMAEARVRAKLLHEVYQSTLLALHRQYFRDPSKTPVPSRVMEDVFSDVAHQSQIKARWIAVNAQVMTLGHEPQDEFEQQAVQRLKTGQDEYEAVSGGLYRRAGVIPLFESCLKCHAPAPLRQGVRRVAGLVISIPVQEAD